MAKKRASASPWHTNRQQAMDTMFSEMSSAGSERLGCSVSVGDESLRDVVGLPLPALCLRYLYQSTVMPLSRITQIAGTEGCCKTSFLFEMMRWHIMYGGGAVFAENEGKDSADLRHAVYQWDRAYVNRTLVVPTSCVNEWQSVWTYYIGEIKKQQTAEGGPGRTYPMLVAVDAITSTATREEIEDIEKNGYAQRGYPLMAQSISRYMRTMPRQIQGFPISVAGTNHLKPSTDARGLPTHTIPGGMSVKFMETNEIIMKRAAVGADIDKADCSGLRLVLKMNKNSAGPSRKQITAEFLWWSAEDPNTGDWRQYAAWDWDTATIDMLLSFENANGKKTLYKNLCEVTGLRVVSKSTKMAYSDVLGIPKDDPQHFRIVAAALERRPDVLDKVYRLLGILRKNEFVHGVDYLQAQLSAAAEIEESAVNRSREQASVLLDTGDGDDAADTDEGEQ